MANIASESKIQLGELLLKRGIITAEQIEDVLAEQNKKGHRKLFGELLVEKGYCTENQIASALAEVYGVPYAAVKPQNMRPEGDRQPSERCSGKIHRFAFVQGLRCFDCCSKRADECVSH